MPEIVGGLQITQWEFTRAWGIEPASASGTGVIAAGSSSAGITVGQYYAFAFGGITFYGIVSSAEQACERVSGYEYPFTMVDNRVRLGWAMVFGQWNMPEDPGVVHADPYPLPSGDAIDQMSGGTVGFDQGIDFTGGLDGGEVGVDNGVDFGDGAFPGGDVLASGLSAGDGARGRVYGHIVPDQWGAQTKTYTTAPRSAASILAEAFDRAVGGYGFALNFHAAQNKPVFNVDANNGMTLASLVSQMCDAQGLQVTLDGQRTLRFARRGGGTVVPPASAHVQRTGYGISADPTRVRVVGDRVLVQMNSIDLEPDWRSSWEQWVGEAAWLDEVKRIIGNDLLSPTITDDAAGRAELASRAREITVRQYILAAGEGADVEAATNNYADFGRWGKLSRMDIPAWVYINSIVFRSYRIPDTTMLFGMPMRSMEIHDSLLCAVNITGEGDSTAIQYRTNPVEFYPQAAAFVIAKGQGVDLLDAVDREALVRVRTTDMRAQWSEIHDFTVDAANHSIHFNQPVFIDGDPEAGESVILFPNQGEGGYDDQSGAVAATSEFLRVSVPNPGYVVSPAGVRCALVFKLGRFYKDYGSGKRWTTASSSAIAEHLLDPSGGTLDHEKVVPYAGDLRMPDPLEDGLMEICYEDGKTAVDLADDEADGLIVRNGVEQAGSYIRHGEVGTSLTGAINRVTITVNRTEGVREQVEFARPRATRGFVASRDIARRIRGEELFDGQEDLRREVRTLKAISKLEREAGRYKGRSTSHGSMSDLLGRPLGAENPSCRTVFDKNLQYPVRDGVVGWKAGDLMWMDDEGLPSRAGALFGGVVVTGNSLAEGTPGKFVTIANAGTAPMAVKPGVAPGVSLRANPGAWFASDDGSYPLGLLNHASAVPGSGAATIALVQLGGGGGSASKVGPFTIVSSRPAYVPAPTSALAAGHSRFFLTWGTCQGMVSSNWTHCIDIDLTTDGRMDFFFKAGLPPSGTMEITSAEWVTSWVSPATDPTDEAYRTAEYAPNGNRPPFAFALLGSVIVADGVAMIPPASAGNIGIYEYVAEIDTSAGTAVGTLIRRALNVVRETY